MPDSNAVSDPIPAGDLETFISTINPDDPEYQKNILRPATIKEDVNLMNQKQRVKMVLNSEAFRRELEEIIRSQINNSEYTGIGTSMLSLQHISELFSAPTAPTGGTAVGLARGQPNGIVPINDLRGEAAVMYSRRERSVRCKLAAVYRLVDLFGWNSSIYNHVTARITSKNEHFLINPYGLLYHEISASSLIKVDLKGDVLDPGSTVLGLNHANWLLHAAVHSARTDIRCIIHIDTPSTVAVSCMKSGLLPLCHEAMILGTVAYYSPTAIFSDELVRDERGDLKNWDAQRATISEALGPHARILFLRSRGLLALGVTIEEAWHFATNAVVACDTQLLLASLDPEQLVLPNENLKQKTYDAWRTSGLGGLSGPEAALAIRLTASGRSPAADGTGYSSGEGDGAATTITYSRPWRLGELEFEAMMRHLDNAGCRTGYLYRQETVSTSHRMGRGKTLDGYTSQDEVTIPPMVSSLTATMAYFYDDGLLSGDETETHRSPTLRRNLSQKHWLNTPNKYTKVMKPSPSHEPISHWVSDREAEIRKAVSSGELPPPPPFHPLTPGALPLGKTGGRATVPTSAWGPHNMFAPQGSDPKEYKVQQKKVKAKYYHDTNTAGPQSRLLDGLTWDEARRVRDEGLMKVLGPKAAALVSQGVTDLPVAAASKAIIHRDARDGAVIYDGVYSHQNPFEQITDEELEMYRREIELKNNPQLVAELERRSRMAADTLSPTSDSLMVDSGATDLDSASDAGPALLHPPITAGTLTSEPSGTDDIGDSQRKKKKKRFKLLSFSLSRSKDKTKDK